MKHFIYLIFFTFLSTFSFAQGDSIQYDLPDIVISENRLDIAFSETSRSIQVITSQQIEQMPVRSVNDLLLYVAGVDIRQRGPNGVQADVAIRGGTFEQTLVLVNGVKLSDPQTGHHLMNLPFDIENVERIEVLKGPAARIYGQNAFAGAINIVTKKAIAKTAKIALRGGENDLGGATFSLALPTEKSNQYFSVSKDFSNGYKHNTDYDISSYFYQSEWTVNDQSLQLIAGYAEREFGANGFYSSPAAQEQYEEVKTSLVSLQYQYKKGAWQITPRINWRKNKDNYVFVRNNPSIYQNIHTNHTLSAEINSHYTSRLGVTGIGVEMQRITLNSTNLGERDRWLGSLFLEHRFQIADRLDISPGFSLNSYSDFGTKFFPGLDLGYRVSDKMKFFGNAGYTYRVPTYTDLYYSDPSNNGNPDLQPEEAIAYEAGLKYDHKGVHIQLAAFQRDGTDLIDWTKPLDTLRWTPININSLTTSGLEWHTQVYFPLLLGSSTILERLHLGYTFIDTNLEDNEAAFSRYALENLDHQLVAGLSYRWSKKIVHSTFFRYTSRVTLDDYSIVDTRLSYRGKQFSGFIEASNLFDTEYKETNLVTMPGRWLQAGVQFEIKL